MRGLADGEGADHGFFVGHRDFDAVEADPAHAPQRAAVQQRDGLAAGVGEDFDFAPFDAADAGAERFHHGFLGRETRRQLGGAAAAVVGLALGEDAAQEALGMPFEHALKAVEQQEIDTASEIGRKRHARSLSPAAGSLGPSTRAQGYGARMTTYPLALSDLLVDGAGWDQGTAHDFIELFESRFDEVATKRDLETLKAELRSELWRMGITVAGINLAAQSVAVGLIVGLN